MKITSCKPLLLIMLAFMYSLQIQAQSQELKKFEGYYHFTDDTATYLQVYVQGEHLILHQMWDDKEISFDRKSDLDFENTEQAFPLKFSNDQNGNITQVLAFNRDVWIRVNGYKPLPDVEIHLKPEELKVFEGKYSFQFEKGKDVYIEITAYDDHLTLKQMWDGKEINFVPKSEVEFFCKEQRFPLKFIKDSSGKVSQMLAFNRDLWQREK